ncbi:MAG: RNA polymerase sigma factor [Vulcanimicrobiaceae bacterium]
MGRWAPPELISAALTGDESAAERLVEAIWPACFTFAAAVIGDWNLAQDAAQEACIIVHQNITSLRYGPAFDSWLYRIVIRESGRVRRRHAASGPSMYAHGFGSDVTATMDVWRALADLPPVLRDVTVLFYFDDLKSDEIAGILHIPHATVRTRLARARERLRGLLDNYGNEQQSRHHEVKKHAL